MRRGFVFTVCPLEPESGDVEYTVVNIKKRSVGEWNKTVSCLKR